MRGSGERAVFHKTSDHIVCLSVRFPYQKCLICGEFRNGQLSSFYPSECGQFHLCPGPPCLVCAVATKSEEERTVAFCSLGFSFQMSRLWLHSVSANWYKLVFPHGVATHRIWRCVSGALKSSLSFTVKKQLDIQRKGCAPWHSS